MSKVSRLLHINYYNNSIIHYLVCGGGIAFHQQLSDKLILSGDQVPHSPGGIVCLFVQKGARPTCKMNALQSVHTRMTDMHFNITPYAMSVLPQVPATLLIQVLHGSRSRRKTENLEHHSPALN